MIWIFSVIASFASTTYSTSSGDYELVDVPEEVSERADENDKKGRIAETEGLLQAKEKSVHVVSPQERGCEVVSIPHAVIVLKNPCTVWTC